MAAAQIVCSFNKFGYCKFRNSCRKMHVYEHCENERCEIRTCRLRHPKPCRYFRDSRRCKFSNCKFKHIILEIENESMEKIKREHEDVQAKLIDIDQKMKQLDCQEKLLEIDENIEAQNVSKDSVIEELNLKIRDMDNKMNNVEEIIREKDLKISQI